MTIDDFDSNEEWVAYQQGRANGYSKAENDYFAQSQKDREDTYNCGYAIGRADVVDECIEIVAGLLAFYEQTELETVSTNNVENELNSVIDEIEKIKGAEGMSNKDKINALNTWELAEFIYKVSCNEAEVTICKEECDKCNRSEGWCVSEIAEWLNKKAE